MIILKGMDEMDNRQLALEQLLKKADIQGYVIFDDIMSAADEYTLSIPEVDWLSEAVATKGIIIYDEAPNLPSSSDDEFDDYAQIDYEEIYTRVIQLDPGLENFIDSIRQIKPPQFREMSQLQYLVREGNQHARSRMYEMHLRNAVRVALLRAETYDVCIADVIQDACVGLMTAVDKYDPNENGSFGSYATLYMLQNVSREQSTVNALVYYPVHKKEDCFAVYPMLKERGCILCEGFCECERMASAIVEKLHCSLEELPGIYEMLSPCLSLEAEYELFADECERTEEHGRDVSRILNYSAFSYIDEDACINCVMSESRHIALQAVLSTLTPREARILSLRYGLTDGIEHTLADVGNALNVTRERIRQIEVKALRKMRHPSRGRILKNYLVE